TAAGAAISAGAGVWAACATPGHGESGPARSNSTRPLPWTRVNCQPVELAAPHRSRRSQLQLAMRFMRQISLPWLSLRALEVACDEPVALAVPAVALNGGALTVAPPPLVSALDCVAAPALASPPLSTRRRSPAPPGAQP